MKTVITFFVHKKPMFSFIQIFRVLRTFKKVSEFSKKPSYKIFSLQ